MGKKSAFTMVELIFVIVILGILAAVAVPKMNASRDDAKIAASIANLKVLMTDLNTAYLAKGGYYKTKATQPTTESACTSAKGTWSGTACTGAREAAAAGDVGLFTGVTLVSGAMQLKDKEDCLKFEISDHGIIKASTEKAAGTTGLCEKFLNVPSVQKLLTGKLTTDKDAGECKLYEGGTAGTAKTCYFNFKTGSIKWG